MRKIRVAISIIELIALVFALYFGYRWYSNAPANYQAAFTVLTVVLVLLLEWVRRQLRRSIDPEMLGKFIEQGQVLRIRRTENPPPIKEHNDWVEQMERYFKKRKYPDYVARLSDFSGMVFYGGSRFENLIDGRLRRLHEFLSENTRIES